MQFSRTHIIIVGSVIFVILLLVGIFTGILPGTRTATEKPPDVTLTVWGLENRSAMLDVLGGYEVLRKNVRASYEQIDPQTYERDIMNALASGTGPDIIMFRNTWLPKHYNKVVPLKETPQMNLAMLKQIFPSVIEQDFVASGKIYALPLYIDTLATFYNQDTFDKNGIALTPKDWLELQNLIPKLRQKDASGRILKPAVAIGGSAATIDNASDILTLLMLQAGAKMTDDYFTQATFSANVQGETPGLDALNFYTKFADQNSIYHTWNDSMESSLDSFAKGDTSVIFAYSSEREAIKNKNPFLNFKIAPMPQPTGAEKAVNYPDYWGLAVTNNSKNPDWAWDAILYLTANDAAAEKYLTTIQRPPALRSLIQKYTDHSELGVFAKQALSARSWPQIDKPAMQNIFSQLISAVISQALEPKEALFQAERQITDLITARR